MANRDTKTWLPYMFDWYKEFEFCSEPYRKLGKLNNEFLTILCSEANSQEYTLLPKLPNLNYRGCAIYNQSGDSKSWALDFVEDSPGRSLYLYGGYIKSVKNINKTSCNLTAPITYKFLDSFNNLKRAHFAKLGNQEIHTHADNPYQTGIRIIINLTNGDKTVFDVYGSKFTINPGDIYWVNTGVPHNLINFGKEPRINILLDIDFQSNLHAELDSIVSDLKSNNYLI